MLRITIFLHFIFSVLYFSHPILSQPRISNFSLDENDITLLPNANDDFFQIFGDIQSYDINLLDYYGNVKQNLNTNSTLVIVQSNNLAGGTYFIRIENISNSRISVQKVIAKQSNEITLIGGWRLIEWYDVIPRDINNDGIASLDLFSQWNGCKKQSILEFNEDQSSKTIYTGGPNNPRCPPNMEMYDFFDNPPWDLFSNSYLEFTGDDYIDSYEIIELSSDVLILKGSSFITCCDASISYFSGGYLKFERVYY